jgi:hypothetical protein
VVAAVTLRELPETEPLTVTAPGPPPLVASTTTLPRYAADATVPWTVTLGADSVRVLVVAAAEMVPPPSTTRSSATLTAHAAAAQPSEPPAFTMRLPSTLVVPLVRRWYTVT